MDPGTAYEIGFMRALDRPVFAYTNCPGSLIDRLEPLTPRPDSGDREDAEGFLAEDFDMADNLMMAAAVKHLEIAVSPAPLDELKAFTRCVAVTARALEV